MLPQNLSLRQTGVVVATSAILRVADCLLQPRVGRKTTAAIRQALAILVEWLFPPDGRFGRKPACIVIAMAGVAAAAGLVWLKACCTTRLGQAAGRVFTQLQRAVFWPAAFPWFTRQERAKGVNELVHMQLLAVHGAALDLSVYNTTPENDEILYQWVGFERYVGKTSLVRAHDSGVPGPAQRFWEHWLHRARPFLKQSGLKKYRLFRRASIGDLGFLVSRAGPSLAISAAEALEIRMHRPGGNGRVQDQCEYRPSAGCGRSRPPRWLRGYKTWLVREGTFEGAVSRSSLRKHREVATRSAAWREQAGPAGGGAWDWRATFSVAYTTQQRMDTAATCRAGPTNIYSPGQWKLFAAWLGTPNQEVDWELLERHWHTSCGPARAWKKLDGCLPHWRRLVAQGKVDKELTKRNLPCTKGDWITVARASFVQPARETIACAIKHHPCWSDEEKIWTSYKTGVLIGKQSSFSDLQNCSKEAQEFDWSALEGTPTSTLRAAIKGTLVRRVECNWDVPRRTSEQEDTRLIAVAIGKWLRKCRVPDPISWRAAAASRLKRAGAWLRETAHWHRSAAQYAADTGKLSWGAQEIICPDDKCKQYRWIMPAHVYFLMLLHYVIVADTWWLTEWSTDEANQWCVLLLLHLVPERLCCYLGIRAWACFLPYCYCSLKPKCFISGART